jgi:hypothetical protein
MRPNTIAVLLLAVVGCGGPSSSTVEAQTAANATAENRGCHRGCRDSGDQR